MENLAVFAPLILLIHILQIGDGLTALAAMLYFFIRLAHYVIYIMALPVVRTLVFIAGFACQAVLAARLFRLV